MMRKLFLLFPLLYFSGCEYPWTLYRDYDEHKLCRIREGLGFPLFWSNTTHQLYFLSGPESGDLHVTSFCECPSPSEGMIVSGAFRGGAIAPNNEEISLIERNDILLFTAIGNFIKRIDEPFKVITAIAYNYSGNGLYVLGTLSDDSKGLFFVELENGEIHQKLNLPTTGKRISIYKDSLIAIMVGHCDINIYEIKKDSLFSLKTIEGWDVSFNSYEPKIAYSDGRLVIMNLATGEKKL